MSNITKPWIGIKSSKLIKEEDINSYHSISDYAKQYDWNNLIYELQRNKTLVNSVRLDGDSLYTPLHQAAHGGAPIHIIEKLINLGAMRSFTNVENETPLDIAIRKGRIHLFEILKPDYWISFDNEKIKRIEENFHKVILERINELSINDFLILPKLSVVFERPIGDFWFAVPGMYGGFKYSWDIEKDYLKCSSWSRVVQGSGRNHIIKPNEIILESYGF